MATTRLFFFHLVSHHAEDFRVMAMNSPGYSKGINK
jgi:hypothetical protein